MIPTSVHLVYFLPIRHKQLFQRIATQLDNPERRRDTAHSTVKEHPPRRSTGRGPRKEEKMQFIFTAQVCRPVSHLPSDSSDPLATSGYGFREPCLQLLHLSTYYFRLTTPELSVTACWQAILLCTWKNLGLNLRKQADT
jgi:hypothetical protein